MNRSVITTAVVLGLAAMLLVAVGGLRAGDGDEKPKDGKFVWKDGKWVKRAEPAKGTVDGELALIQDYLDKGKNGDALKTAEEFIKNRHGIAECEEVMMLAAKAEMANGYYYNAYEWLERQLSNYPGGEYSDRALDLEYQIAEAYLQGRKRRALKIFRLPAEEDGLVILGKIPGYAPGTELAQKSLLRIADQHWTKQRWTKAADGYDAYLSLFPKGAKAGYAMFQAARATYASYRGEKYDDTPLIDAEQRFKTYLKQFPQEAEANKVSDVLKDITAKRAEKLFSTAAFYERTGSKPSAKYYYQQLADKYPDSAHAGQARSALKRLSDVKISPDRLSHPLESKPKKEDKPEKAENTKSVEPVENVEGVDTPDNKSGVKGRPDCTDEAKPDAGPAENVEKVEKAETRKDEKPVHLEELAPETPEPRPDYTDETDEATGSRESRPDYTDEPDEAVESAENSKNTEADKAEDAEKADKESAADTEVTTEPAEDAAGTESATTAEDAEDADKTEEAKEAETDEKPQSSDASADDKPVRLEEMIGS